MKNISLSKFFSVVVVTLGLFAVGATADASGQSIDGVKCIVSGSQNARRAFSVPYADGEIYFCCGRCAKTFTNAMRAGKSDFIVKANHQLALTGQYVQSLCPVGGTDFDATHHSNIGGVEIAFCCGGCQAKVDRLADTKARVEMIFSADSFGKHFTKKKIDLTGVKCAMRPNAAAREAHVADYGDGKVHFCCPRCVKTFQKDPRKFTAAANCQLVKTNQYVQTRCPITGGKINPAKTVPVGGVEVAVCCGRCQAKLESASDDAARMEMVFGGAAFKKSFAKAP